MLVNPIEALDLRDKRDQPDHSKIMGFFAFLVLSGLVSAYVFGISDKLLPIGHMIVLGSLAFGWPAWRAFLGSRTVTSAETIVAGDDMYNADERGEFTARESVNPVTPVGFKF